MLCSFLSLPFYLYYILHARNKQEKTDFMPVFSCAKYYSIAIQSNALHSVAVQYYCYTVCC